jgi:hypothetical protein
MLRMDRKGQGHPDGLPCVGTWVACMKPVFAIFVFGYLRRALKKGPQLHMKDTSFGFLKIASQSDSIFWRQRPLSFASFSFLKPLTSAKT